MTSIEKPKTIGFLGKEFTMLGLKQAIIRSGESYIEPGKEIHETMFDQNLVPEDWKGKHGRTILTIHEGKYVVLYRGPDFNDNIGIVEEKKTINGQEMTRAKTQVVKGFKAVFVTKYNFNQAKYEPPSLETVPVPTPTPVYGQARSYNNNRYGDKSRTYGQQNQNGGFKNNNHRGGNRY